ncbi:striatin [Tritrichomonas foetus]|uniref:Striatin n=1 Tax=Tritrichomonas foetus TaxID=1144522 RepID=A0A1J4JLE8_9EUKA|nr:striatin [Tritrichomonas foetus]|eukprot:OHS99906.1 striatin [Tritrichomonas foetus]
MLVTITSLQEQIAEMKRKEAEWEADKVAFLSRIAALKQEQEQWPSTKDSLLNQLRTLRKAADAPPSERQNILQNLAPIVLPSQESEETQQTTATETAPSFPVSTAKGKKVTKGGKKRRGGHKSAAASSSSSTSAPPVEPENTETKAAAADSTEPSDTAPFEFSLKWSLTQHLDCIRCVTFHPTLAYIATGSDDGTVRVTNLDPPKRGKARKNPIQIMSLRGHNGPVLSIAARQNSLISGDINGQICVWDFVETKGTLMEIHGKVDHHLTHLSTDHKDAVWSIATHENSPFFVSASADKTIRLFDSQTNDSSSISIPEGPSVVSFNSDGTTFIVGCVDGNIHIFKERQKVGSYNFTSHVVSMCPSYSPDQMFIACENKNINIFNITANTVANSFVAHEGYTSGMALVPGLAFLVTTSADKTIRVWRSKSLEVVSADAHHREKYGEAGLCVAATLPSNTHKYFASGGADGVIRIFGRK